MATVQGDKKAEGGKVKFVLPKKIGEVVVTKSGMSDTCRNC
jgi:3-dehydroquinate synthetase